MLKKLISRDPIFVAYWIGFVVGGAIVFAMVLP